MIGGSHDMNIDHELEAQAIFNKLKLSCVPILGLSALSPSSVLQVSQLLSNLITTLQDVRSSGFILTSSLISYTFFPLSTILRRNASSAIPDQVFEKMLVVLGILWEDWWWDCDMNVWEQSFMLCSAVLGGIEGKEKGRSRDDETKTAAARCLLSLLRERTAAEGSRPVQIFSGHISRLAEFQARIRETKFIPVLGESLNALLTTAESHHLPLQRLSLRLLHILISLYAPGDFMPSILPGSISCLTKAALGKSGSKKWANGEIAAAALEVMQEVVIRSIADDVCIKDGALRDIGDIDDLIELATEPEANPSHDNTRPYVTARTQSWLRGTSSQLHIALNALTPLVSHPSPPALIALTEFSSRTLAATVLSLPQSQNLLVSFLLSLSNSTFASVSSSARNALLQLLSPSSKARSSLLRTMMQSTRENLASLPRLLPSHADDRVEHISGLVIAVCQLATASGGDGRGTPNLSSIRTGIGKLLGPTGGIEKWGWSLLSVLEFDNPSTTISQTSAAQLALESDTDLAERFPFPEVTFKHVASRTASECLVRMFRSLGRAGGDGCFYSVEWFANTGRNSSGARSSAALWCACRLLEGAGDVCLDSGYIGDGLRNRSKRLEKLTRGLVKSVAELWDEEEGEQSSDSSRQKGDFGGNDVDGFLPVEHRKGIVSIRATVEPTRYRQPAKPQSLEPQRALRKAFCLHLLSISAGILQARFTPLLQHVLYPILHSLVSPRSHLSSTALATLNFITTSTSYASVANLLLSNFDYALDSLSRRLTRRWLDVDATKVFLVLVRLVGSDVVQKAGDIVEECFDRLDDFHGYEVIVENLLHVLTEVISVVKSDEEAAVNSQVGADPQPRDSERLDSFVQWFAQRKTPPTEEQNLQCENMAEEDDAKQESDPNADPPSTPAQLLTKQIVSRSVYFLTHGSPVIRARILTLLSSSVPVLPESALLPSIHLAWPFILNRFTDPEPFVVGAAAALVEALATYVGGFMSRKIWDDVWPCFRVILSKLDAADATSAFARRGRGGVGTESAYTHSHRLYKSLLKTMTAALRGVQVQDTAVWQVILAFRRFLHHQAHDELQACARDLYVAIGLNNEDAVWLALSATTGKIASSVSFLREPKWGIERNSAIIFQALNQTH